MRKLIYLLPLLLFVCLGCGEVADEEEVVEEDTGGVAYLTSVWPADDGGEPAMIILNNAAYHHVYFTFNDITFVKDSKIFVNNVPVTSVEISNGMQSFLFEPSNLVGDKKGILNNVAVLWVNTNGTHGYRTFVFNVVDYRPASDDQKPLDPNDPYVMYYDFLIQMVEHSEKHIEAFEKSGLCHEDWAKKSGFKAREDSLFLKLNAIVGDMQKAYDRGDYGDTNPNLRFFDKLNEYHRRSNIVSNRMIKAWRRCD